MGSVLKMRFKSCLSFLVTMNSGKLFAEGKFCDLPHVEDGRITPYYYNFKGYYFLMHKGKNLSYSCVAGFTTETRTQDGRITCTAKGCHSGTKNVIGLLWNMAFFTAQKHTSKYTRNYSKNVIKATEFPAVVLKIQYNVNQVDGLPRQAVLRKLSCQVPALHHGNYFTTQRELRVNEALLYRCDEGYHTAGGNATEEAVCLARGRSLTPNCSIQTAKWNPSAIWSTSSSPRTLLCLI